MVKAADTMKTSVDQITTASSQAFKDGVEKSLAALNDINAQSKQNLEALVASATAATRGAEALGAQAIAFSKKSVEDQAAAAQSLTTAKSIQEVVELQTAWAKTAMETYLAQMNQASELVAASIKESMTPINARMTAAVEKFQATR